MVHFYKLKQLFDLLNFLKIICEYVRLITNNIFLFSKSLSLTLKERVSSSFAVVLKINVVNSIFLVLYALQLFQILCVL